MLHQFFKSIESYSANTTIPLDKVIEQLVFNEKGLIPVITQDAKTKDILMFAWMNKVALEKTINTGNMVYWSRSRQELWEKGATSGHTQTLVNMSFDCDGDAIICQVKQKGAACHTGSKSCFYIKVDRLKKQVNIIGDQKI